MCESTTRELYCTVEKYCIVTSLLLLWCPYMAINVSVNGRSTPVAQLAPRNLLTRWDVSSIPANGIFLTKN